MDHRQNLRHVGHHPSSRLPSWVHTRGWRDRGLSAVRWWRVVCCLAVAAGLALGFAPGQSALAASLVVSNCNASGVGSLTAAVATANTNAQADTITINATCSGPDAVNSGATLVFADTAGATTITRGSSSGFAVSGGNARTVLQVNTGVQVTLNGITITRGKGANGTNGNTGAVGYSPPYSGQDGGTGGAGDAGGNGGAGGINNLGTLTLIDVAVVGNNGGNGGTGGGGGTGGNGGPYSGNGATGGAGGNGGTGGAGGIANAGNLTLTSSIITGGTGGAGGIGGGGGTGGAGGLGTSNGGHSGGGGAGGNGGVGGAGGIANTGSLALTESTISDNNGGAGSTGGAGGTGTIGGNTDGLSNGKNGGGGGGGGNGGSGGPGGIAHVGTLTLAKSTVSGNAGGGGGWGGNAGNAGNGGNAVGGGGGTGGPGGNGGTGGAGAVGGIANGGTLTLAVATVSGNTGHNGAPGGGGGNGGNGGSGWGGGNGGAAGNGGSGGVGGAGGIGNSSTLTLVSATVSANLGGVYGGGGGSAGTAGRGAGGNYTGTNGGTGTGGTRPDGGSGGVGHASGTATIGSTILAGNSGSTYNGTRVSEDYIGTTVTDNGRNVIGVATGGATFAGTGTQTGVTDPQLGALADNGGPSRTQLPATTSPAVNAGAATCNVTYTDAVTRATVTLTTDQRGLPRPLGTKCDSGSVEAELPDATAPTTTATLSGTRGNNGWYRSGVTVTLAPTDPDETALTLTTTYAVDGGTQTAYTAPFTVSGDGTHTVAYFSTDRAGNVETTKTETFMIDATAPTGVSGTPARPANASGWYNAPVVVTFSGTDALSGIASCTSPNYSGPDRASASVTGTCTDQAGNTSAPASFSVKYDTTRPVTTTTPARPANANGWYNGPVTVTMSASDALSGVAKIQYNLDNTGWTDFVPGTPITITGDLIHTLSYHAIDNAGNQELDGTLTIRLDTTAPTGVIGAAARAADSNSWYNASVGITFSGLDSLSGVASCTSASYSGPDSAAAAVSGTCTDTAGNVGYGTFTLNYDASAPTAVAGTPDRPANANGWYNAPVVVTFGGTDVVSGIANCTSTTYSGPDSTATTVTGSCTDTAGNISQGSFGPFAIDTVAPTVTYTGNAGTYTANQTVTITCQTGDTLSGVASNTCQTITGPASSFLAGENTYSATATDNAGNVSAPASTTFTVLAPVPTLVSAAPSTIAAGSGDTTITLTGTSFVPGANSVATLDGVPLATTRIDDTHLTAIIPAARLAAAGQFTLTVANPGPGGGTSNPLNVTVTNPAPTLNEVSPAKATAGAGDTALTLAGSGFTPGTTVQFGGIVLTPDPTSAATKILTVTIPQALLADPRTVAVTVTNPGPGGGTSAPQTFTVAAPASAPAQATIAPAALSFGGQQIGSASDSRQVTMTNGGGSVLAVSGVTIVGANPGDFTLTFNTCVGNVPAGGSCVIGVRFAPVAAGARAAALSIAASTAGSPQTVTLTGTGTTPPASPVPQATVTASAQGSGTVSPAGATSYTVGSQATYAASASAGQIFLGWTLDGTSVGYASPLTFTVDANRTLVATFAARPTFNDIPSTDPDYEAITRLAALGIINPRGADGAGNFQPGRAVARAEVAAFIARLYGRDKEFHANPFPDRCDPTQPSLCVDDVLWNAVAALRDYGVVGGYTDPDTCASVGTTTPCYLPRDEVSRLQVVSIVARAFTKAPDQRPTGYWDRLPAVPGQYANIPDSGTQRSDLATYRQNAGPIPGQADDGQFPDPAGTASRRFIIQVLWQAYAAQFGIDRVP